MKVNKRQKRGVYSSSGHCRTHERPKKGHSVALQVYLNFGNLSAAPNSTLHRLKRRKFVKKLQTEVKKSWVNFGHKGGLGVKTGFGIRCAATRPTNF